MKRENINYIVVGVFVLAMLAVFFVVLYQITGRTGPTDDYYVVYENVTGIKYGTPVLYEGYQIGQVENIEPVRDRGKTRYRLTLSVNKGWEIPSDSVAQIFASGLLAAITIDIEEGESETVLSPGDTLQGKEAANILSAVNEVAADLQDLSRNSIRPLIDNLNTSIERLVNDITNLTSGNIRPMLENVNKRLDKEIFTDFDNLLVKLNESADRLLVLLDDTNQENLDEFLANMQSASTNLNEVIFRIEDTRSAMNEVLLNIDRVVVDNQENIKTSINDLQKTMNSVSQNINAIVHHMEGTSRNMHELSRQIRQNPGLILRGSPQPDEGDSQ